MTKSKAPLAMMEQMVMLLVFALAAALCLQAFVKSDEMSKRSEARDRAMVLCQNVAEAMRASGLSASEAAWEAAEKLGCRYDKGTLYQEYDENWNPVEPGELGVYRLDAGGIPTELPNLQAAHVCVRRGFNAGQETETIFELEVAWQWQEVSAHD